jgi:hypothetical protein
MNYWPDTKIPKSRGNAFDWRHEPSQILSKKDWKSAETAQLQTRTGKTKAFTIYSKAKAIK